MNKNYEKLAEEIGLQEKGNNPLSNRECMLAFHYLMGCLSVLVQEKSVNSEKLIGSVKSAIEIARNSTKGNYENAEKAQ